jgi:hypothetical protein
MYRIDSMYEAMIEAVLEARAEGKASRWMACSAWWLGRQQIFGAVEFWQTLAAKVTSVLSSADRASVVEQLSKQEEALVAAADAWPDVPETVSRFVSAWAPAEVDLATLKADALRRIDASAEDFRLQFLTPGSGQAMAYQQKLAEARAKLADPSIADAEIPHIISEAEATGMSKADKAAQIVATFEAWQQISAVVEGKRAAAKLAVEAAESAEAVASAANVEWSGAPA